MLRTAHAYDVRMRTTAETVHNTPQCVYSSLHVKSTEVQVKT